MSVIIKFLKRESISKVLHFFNSAQSDILQNNNRSQEEFEWLFFNSYYKPSLYAVASESESDEIIGTYAGIFIPMVAKNSDRIITIKGEDTLISLDVMIRLGKRDILKELLQTIIEKSKDDNAMIFWGFSNAKSAYRRCGFKIVTQIKGSFYVTKPIKFYKNRVELFPQLKLIKKFQLFLFAWFNFLTIKLKSVNTGGYSLRRITFDEMDEKALVSFIPDEVYATFLNKDFLRWRIMENPSPLQYGFLEFRDNKGMLAAYFIFSSNKEKIFFIEQFLFDRQLTDNKKVRVMKMALSYCRRQNAIMVRAMGLTHNKLNRHEMKLFTKTGFYFFNNPEESFFVFKDLSEHGINPEDIYLSRLNTQGIR